VSWEAPVPPDMQALIETLRTDAGQAAGDV
jgi:hypothetical protein